MPKKILHGIVVSEKENINIHYLKKYLKVKKNIVHMMKKMNLKMVIKFQLLNVDLIQKIKNLKF